LAEILVQVYRAGARAMLGEEYTGFRKFGQLARSKLCGPLAEAARMLREEEVSPAEWVKWSIWQWL
jgi:hypothetical protein